MQFPVIFPPNARRIKQSSGICPKRVSSVKVVSLFVRVVYDVIIFVMYYYRHLPNVNKGNEDDDKDEEEREKEKEKRG